MSVEYKNILDNLFMAVIVTNSDGKLIYTNEACKKINNYEKIYLLLKDRTYRQKVVKHDKYYLKIRTGTYKNINIHQIDDITKDKEREFKETDFVSMAAHELRTPLNSIRGYLTDFMSETKGLTKQQQETLNRIHISATRLNALLNSILHSSHIEQGLTHIKREPVSIEGLIQNVVEDYQQKAKQNNINIIFIKSEQEIISLSADIEKIRQVITNLITNAILYNKKNGSITIQVKTKPSFIEVSVEDTGIGIPKEAQRQLFTKFFRVSENIDEESQGAGLGLYICKAIIDLHDGKIWVESKLGKGTKFTFTLPTGE